MTRLVLETEGPARGRRPVPAGALGPSGPASAAQLASLASSSARRWTRRASPRRRSSTWSSPVALGGEEEQASRRLHSRRSERTRRSRSGRRIPIVSGRPRAGFRAVPRIVRAGAGLGRRRALVVGRLGVRVTGRGFRGRCVADRNRGLCCLWIADHDGAVAALRRYIARTGPTIDAVDLEALCQRIERTSAPRSRRIRSSDLADPEPRRAAGRPASATRPSKKAPGRPLDPNDPKSPEVERFFLLDRPRIEAKPGLTRQEIPLIQGEVLVGQDTVILEAYDDGRLDRLIDRFTAAAGSNIPPAHPRTKVIGKEQRHLLGRELALADPRGALGRGSRAAQPRAGRVISSARSGPRRPTRPCAGGRRSRPPRPAMPRRLCARPSSSSKQRTRIWATCSTGTSSARNSTSSPSPPSSPDRWTSTSFTCLDCR